MVRKSLLKELINRRVPQIIGSYFVAGTSLIFFIQYLVDKYQFPPHYPTLALFALVGILPSVIILSYFHGAPGKDQWTKLEKYAIPANILFIATILLISFQHDYWKVEIKGGQVELTEEAQDPLTVLIHITSLGKYKSEYEEEVKLAARRINGSMGRYYYLTGNMRLARVYFLKSRIELKTILYLITTFVGSKVVKKYFKIFG